MASLVLGTSIEHRVVRSAKTPIHQPGAIQIFTFVLVVRTKFHSCLLKQKNYLANSLQVSITPHQTRQIPKTPIISIPLSAELGTSVPPFYQYPFCQWSSHFLMATQLFAPVSIRVQMSLCISLAVVVLVVFMLTFQSSRLTLASSHDRRLYL